MIQLKMASLTAISLLLFLSAGCSNSSQPQSTPASPATATEIPAPGLTPINRVKDKVNDAQEKDKQRREETQNP